MATPLPPPSTSFQLNRPTVIALLYLGGFFTGGITVLIGLVLAYMWPKEPHEPWEADHYRWHIRSFWMALLYLTISVLLFIVGIGFLIYAAVPIWFGIRAIKALLAAQRQESLPNVESWLI